ncbi:hypothetical protein C7S16_1404 [Burkholderia thailandensis]|uniref:Uncharacterized protein n=1 Tax=Burkholderia thailandensis TaxID=57975 RepID=A0AAW9CV27_BURTH|nr:hypothetical protein [Burkholderia thailandensis]MDW9254830.1 hypothetical protein [Burkholderia thailandensis]
MRASDLLADRELRPGRFLGTFDQFRNIHTISLDVYQIGT